MLALSLEHSISLEAEKYNKNFVAASRKSSAHFA